MSTLALLPVLAVVSTAPLAQVARVPEAASEVKPPARAYEQEADATDVAPTPATTAPRRVDAAGALQADRDRLFCDVAADGTVWVRGRTYKASFSRDAATYVPFLGSRAPRNFPVEMRVSSVTIAGEELAFDAAAPAVRRGDSIEYARGPFVERYVLTPDSVEQTFVFDELPRRGEIVVALGIASDMPSASDADGFVFGNEYGHVRYGRAFALHDELAPTPIASRLAGGTIELRAPAALVEGAVGRFVIDPVLTTFAVENGLADEFGGDTAFDSTNGIWVTVAEEVFSADDHDIHAVRHTSAGTISGQDYVDISGEDWRSPAIAGNNVDDQFLVVAARGTAPSRAIWGRTVEATASLNMSAQFRISDPADAHDLYLPDVGGDIYVSGPTYYCVVWEREFIAAGDYDIHARLVRTDTSLVGPSTLIIDNSAATIHRRPSISNRNGGQTDTDRDWNVVWEDQASPTNRNILGARVHFDGTIAAPTFTVASSILDERNPTAAPHIEGSGVEPWMVAYQIDSGANGWDVRCRSFDGTAILSTLDLSEQFPSVALDQVTPSCDTGGGQFVVVYDERSGAFFTTTDIKVASIYSIAGALGVNEGNVSASPGLFVDTRPRVVTKGFGAGQINDAQVVFDRDDSGPNDVYVTGYDVPNGGPVTNFCAGDGTGTACPCGNSGAAGHGCASSVNPAGALLSSTGTAAIGLDSLVLSTTGLPGSAPVLFFQGTAQSGVGPGTVFGDGLRCASGTVVRLATKTASSGMAQYPAGADLPVSQRGAVPNAGAVRYYQGWYRNSAAFCTASTFNLTNGLRVQWIH